MATDEQWDALPDVEEQEPLDEPLKIEWYPGVARSRVRTGLHAALESDWTDRALAIRCMDRLDVSVVVKTEDERQALLAELRTLDSPAEWGVEVGHHPNARRAIQRVIQELETDVVGAEGDDEDSEGLTCSCGSLAIASPEGGPCECSTCGDVLGGSA